MEQTASGDCMDLWAVVPEMVLAGLTLFLVPVAGWVRGRWVRLPTLCALIGLVAAMGLTAPMLDTPPQAAFCGTYAVDPFRAFYQLVVQAGAFVSILVLAAHFKGHRQEAQAPVTVLFATVGGMGLAAAIDLGLIVLFLQILSIAGYLLVGLVRTEPRTHEALVKYFVYAGVALAAMAYGLTLVFGMTGSLELRAIGQALGTADPVWVTVAFGLLLIGYGFEMTVVPFHFWAPDVFQGSSAPVAGFLSVVPKTAAFGGLLRFLLEAMPDGLSAWPLILAGLAVATMTLGNLAALRQRTLKRMLAYSSIAQAGYMLMAAAVAERTPDGLPAVGFYLIAYLLMNIAAFAVAAQVERTVGGDGYAALRGLGRRAPWPAAALGLALLSLAGIPPFAGFAGKVFVLSAAIDGGMSWLAVIGAINMAVALYYYAFVLAEMFFREGLAAPPPTGGGYLFALGLTTAGTLALGIAPVLGLALATAGAVLR